MRSPSGCADGSSRGEAPTDTTSVSASMRSKSVPPASVETTTAPEPSRRPWPEMMRTPASSSDERMSSDCCRASESSR